MNRDRFKAILSNFNKLKIAVVGDIMLDDYLIGTVERVSPEAPVPVVLVKKEKFVLGGAGNVVNNLSALGVKTYCYGIVGDDTDGEKLLRFMKKIGVETPGIIKSEEKPKNVK